ncbi:FAD binding domain-containing protein [Desulforhopalus singaporensis]|uniref:Carbon-monoxide dehydrogenase medium subunit n=1 Tax=Desulforhopalus singaporensis TaxID=91360 RepID=A0A1H0N6U6_9BACT|nr:xanthine dehydrogenase family protein subunit M [Desulforhopalus singaporensis]SDO88341.1 carbon-monoxide dehydrogenase medium subunit [Desulforhopalus singaporensis]
MSKIAYIKPDSVGDAIEILADKGSSAAIIAGGTDVMVDLRSGEITPEYLVDISRLEELKGIRMENDELVIGAGVTLSEIYNSDLLAEYAPALKKSAYNFASAQIRNIATIGGNVAHCSPCGDTIPPLVIHEAEVLLSGKDGQKRIPIEQVATGPYRSFLEPHELITAFVLKPRKAAFADFKKIGRRKDLAISRLSMAVMIDKSDDGTISFMRFSLGACTPTPHRMIPVEEFMVGKKPTEKLLFEGGRLLAESMIEITGRRPSIIYKEPAVQGLFVRMLHPVVN